MIVAGINARRLQDAFQTFTGTRGPEGALAKNVLQKGAQAHGKKADSVNRTHIHVHLNSTVYRID